MNSLYYLLFLRAKAYIRKLFSKVSSAIITVLAILCLLWLFWLMSSASDGADIKIAYELFVMIYLGFVLFLISAMFFQKRTALISEEDANYIIVGPYTNRQIILYGILYSLCGAMLYALMNYIYGVCIFGSFFDIKDIDIFTLLIGTILLYFIFFCLIDLLYLRFMNSKYQVIIKRSVILGFLLIILGLFGYYYLNNQYSDFNTLLLSFISSDLFNYVPVIGWFRAFLISSHHGLYISSLINLGLLLITAFLIFYFTLNTKEIDPELIMSDAMWYSDLKRRTKDNQSNLNINLKIHDVKDIKWGNKAKAISSRMILDMRKTNSFITKQEIMLIVLYLVISIFNDFGFMFYARYVTIVLVIITMSSNFNDELKHHYIYLIPDTAINKLIAILKPTILKLLIVIITMLIVGVILKPTILEFIMALLELIGYALLFVSANIWSLRILKSNDNQVSNQFIKMFLIIVAILPSILLGMLFGFIIDINLFSIFSSLVNIVVAIGFMYASIGVVSGINLMDE